MAHYGLGALKDPVDVRDFELRKVTTPVKLPPSVDYEKDMSPVRNQGTRGSCVAFASVAVKEYQERKQRKSKPRYDFSEEWVYRLVMHPGGGAYPRDAFKILLDNGVCRDAYMPYEDNASDAEKLPFTPSAKALRNAKYYKASSYARLTSLEEMKQSLVINGPFLLGITWYEEWFSPDETIKGYPIIRPPKGAEVGGHAICVVGYDEEIQAFKIRNSWGPEWGKGGYAWLSYDIVRKDGMDAWATLDVTNSHVKLETVTKLKEKVDAT